MKWWQFAAMAFVFGAMFSIGGLFAAIINPLPYIFQNGTTADATQVNADLSQILANVNSNALPISSYVPVPFGAIMAFNLSACPTGWQLADGTAGAPNLEGYFIRGLDLGVDGPIDPGRILNTLQQDQLQDHTHATTTPDGTVASGPGGINAGAIGNNTGIPNSGNHGSETRPKNIALLYCMKS